MEDIQKKWQDTKMKVKEQSQKIVEAKDALKEKAKEKVELVREKLEERAEKKEKYSILRNSVHVSKDIMKQSAEKTSEAIESSKASVKKMSENITYPREAWKWLKRVRREYPTEAITGSSISAALLSLPFGRLRAFRNFTVTLAVTTLFFSPQTIFELFKGKSSH